MHNIVPTIIRWRVTSSSLSLLIRYTAETLDADADHDLCHGGTECRYCHETKWHAESDLSRCVGASEHKEYCPTCGVNGEHAVPLADIFAHFRCKRRDEITADLTDDAVRRLNDRVSLLDAVVKRHADLAPGELKSRMFRPNGTGALKLEGSFVFAWKFTTSTAHKVIFSDVAASIDGAEGTDIGDVTETLLQLLTSTHPSYISLKEFYEVLYDGTNAPPEAVWAALESTPLTLSVDRTASGAGVIGVILTPAEGRRHGFSDTEQEVHLNPSAGHPYANVFIQKNNYLINRQAMAVLNAFPLLFPRGSFPTTVAALKHHVIQGVQRGAWPSNYNLLVQDLLIKVQWGAHGTWLTRSRAREWYFDSHVARYMILS